MRLFVLVLLILTSNLVDAQSETDGYDNNACRELTKEEIKDSIEVYKLTLEGDPTNTTILYRLGMSYYSLHDFQNALTVFNSLIEIDACYSYAFNNRAHCKIWLKDKQGACQDFEHSLNCDSSDSYIKQEYERLCEQD